MGGYEATDVPQRGRIVSELASMAPSCVGGFDDVEGWMGDHVRVGLVGADARGRGWGAMAHLPALRSVEGIEVAALCTSRPESAAAAQAAYGIRTFHDVHELAVQSDVDLVAVAVRVPFHHEVVMPLLRAGKHVFCEWPLGANLTEAKEMATTARDHGVVTGVGLQGRRDPTLTHLRDLHAQGWLGDVTSVNMTMFDGGAGKTTSGTAWMGDASNGANLLTIVVGHSLDYLSYCLGPPGELVAAVDTLVPHWQVDDTDETVEVDAPDSVVATGTLDGGGRVVLHMASVPFNGTGWRMQVHGTKGTVIATTRGLPQITPVQLEGAQGDDQLQPLAIPQHLLDGPRADGPASNIARAYRDIAHAIRAGGSFTPDFDHAVRLHERLESLQHRSDQ